MSIIFSIGGRSNLTLERGRIVPYTPVEYQINQELYLTESNNPKVVDYGGTAQFIKLAFSHLSKDNYDGAINGLNTWFLSSEVNWAGNSFTMTDESGATHTVRFWQKRFAMLRDGAGRYSLSITLLKE